MILTEEDKSTQTLLLDRAYKSFRIGVALRNPGRAENDFYTGGFENLPKASAVFGVPVNNQVRFAKREALYCVHELTGSLFHPFGVGWPQVQAADSALSILPDRATTRRPHFLCRWRSRPPHHPLPAVLGGYFTPLPA